VTTREAGEPTDAAAERAADLVPDYEFDVEFASHPPRVRRLLRESLPLLGAPGDTRSIEELEAAIARTFGVESRNVVVFPGTRAAIQLMLANVDRYVTLPLCYTGVGEEVWAMGRHAPPGLRVPDLDRGADELRQPMRTMLFVDSPSYFTGARITLEQAIDVSRRARGDSFMVVDASSTLLFHLDARYASNARLVFLGSFAKVFLLGGLRLAFGVGPAELLQEFRPRYAYNDLSTFILHVAPKLLDELPHYRAAHLERRRARIHNGDVLRELLREHVVEYLSRRGHAKVTFLSRPEERPRLIERLAAIGLPPEALEFFPDFAPPGLDLGHVRPFPARFAPSPPRPQ